MVLVVVPRAAVNTATSPTFKVEQFELLEEVHVNVTDGPGCAVTFAPVVVVLLPAVAVTVVSALVVNWTRAWPLTSVRAVALLKVPRSAENVTETPERARPPMPVTTAMTSTVPPLAETVDGFVLIVMASTAAAPTVICTTLADVDVVVPVLVEGVVEPPPPAPPDCARTSATPEASPAKNVVVASPLRVSTSIGSRRPRFVVKRTVVPFCTGVPADSITYALTSVEPPNGNVSVV